MVRSHRFVQNITGCIRPAAESHSQIYGGKVKSYFEHHNIDITIHTMEGGELNVSAAEFYAMKALNRRSA